MNNIKNSYELSKDYEKLYDMVCAGHRIIGFADYEFGGGEIVKDVCSVKKDEYNTQISSKGVCYGHAGDYAIGRHAGSEKNAFIAMCKNCNFEYIQPNIGVDKAESEEQ